MRKIVSLLVLFLLPIAAHAADSLDEAQKRVETLRGKKFVRTVERATMPRSELRRYLTQQIVASAGSTEKYRRILETMQFVEPDPQLVESMLKLYEAQVLAFYDPETHRYYSLDAPPAGLPTNAYLDDLVVVHELTHALQDQRFDAGAKIAKMEDDWDRELAYHALLEGEATLVMLEDLLDKMGQPLRAVLAEKGSLDNLMKAADMTAGVPADAPRFLVESMKFPYLDGLKFVVEAYRRNGWRGVDALHDDPPQSSEEVLHPEMYFERVTKKSAARSESLAAGTYYTTHLGEFFWRQLVGDAAAAGADTSTFTIREDKKKGLTSFIDSSWDSEADAKEFAAAYRGFLEKRGLKSEMRVEGKRVRVAYGADAKGARRFVSGS